MNGTEKASVRVLRECIELQLKKAHDYQNPASTVTQADYYPRGIESIHDMMNTKMLRLRSVMDTMQADGAPNFESLTETAKDLINYASFFVAYLEGKVPGQSVGRNIFNKPNSIQTASNDTPASSVVATSGSLASTGSILLNEDPYITPGRIDRT